MKKKTFTVGIDLGGTKLAAALVDNQGKILSFRKESILHLKENRTPARSQKEIIKLMTEMIEGLYLEFPHAFKGRAFRGVGLASAGPLNVEKGILINPSNFAGWKTVPVCKMLSQALRQAKLPSSVFFQNDAIAASLAEGWVGKARGLQTYAVITVGTGIGTGVILNYKPVQSQGMGSEFGHLIANNSLIHSVADLHPQTVEGIASGTGILRRAKLMGFGGNSIEELFIALSRGETKWQVLFDEAADALAALCYNLSIGFHLQKILFSGGLIKIHQLYLKRTKKRYEELTREMNSKFIAPISIAQTKNRAGVLGAAYLPYLQKESQ